MFCANCVLPIPPPRRHAFVSKPRNKMSEKQRRLLEQLQQQEVPGHGGGPFMTEADLRALQAFKKGEVRPPACAQLVWLHLFDNFLLLFWITC